MNGNMQEWMRGRADARVKITIEDYNHLLMLVTKCAMILNRQRETIILQINDDDLAGFTPICDEVTSEDAFNDLERSLGINH